MKRLLKIIGSIFFIGLVLLAVLVLVNIIDDRPSKLRAEYERYINNPRMEDNIFVYLQGLDADDNTDVYSSGKKKIEQGLAELKNMSYENFNPSMPEPELKGEKIKKPECIFEYYENTECNITLDQINNKIADNSILFSRLVKANEYSNYEEIFIPRITGYKNIIFANQILAAKAVLEAKAGNTEVAYNIWLQNYLLNKKIYTGSYTAVGMATAILNYSMSLRTLAAMLHYRPELAKIHYSELDQVLTRISLKDIKLKELTMIEFAIPYHVILGNMAKPPIYLENNSLNQYLDYYEDFLKFSVIEPSQYAATSKELHEKYSKDSPYSYLSLRNPIFKMVNGLLIGGLVKSDELFLQVYRKENYLIMLKASIDIRSKEVKDIKGFLSKNKAIYYNVINANTIDYDDSGFLFTQLETSETKLEQPVTDKLYF